MKVSDNVSDKVSNGGRILSKFPNRKVMVVGAGGQLGSDLLRAIGNDDKLDVIPIYHENTPFPDSPKIDVRSFPLTLAAMQYFKPDWVVNTAAFHQVDKCEKVPMGALEVNAYGAANCAVAAREVGARYIFISTDYVFGHDGPWKPSDHPSPLNVYGISKHCGERLVHHYYPDAIVVRSSSLFGVAGSSGKRGNFIETMMRLGVTREIIEVVDDVTMSPTYTLDLANYLCKVMSDNLSDCIVHAVNDGFVTWKGLAEEIFAQTGLNTKVTGCSTIDRDKATKPRHSGLVNQDGKSDLRPWQDGLRDYLREKGYVA